MNNVFNLNNLRPGDRLVLPKSEWDLIQHHVIYIGTDANGNRSYIENFAGKGVQLVNEKRLFRDGHYVTRIEPFVGDIFQRNEAIKRAMQLIGKPYDLVNFNCEHYANTVQHNKSYSKQVNIGLVAGLIALVLSIGFTR
ncbi:lecithin retinol acyltransferase family protein [Agriterribacter sp.]|jgi:hypothetical protein|uniref:lecithin retinol acyltransferase family protein n=1 Tax=Agriterribacter sp. TaxID=2821509 RepID=UPI002C4E3EF5|nr:lecithin retinol acyltransferase family protein [Agriterribacter sp.]HRN48398.1 lecithin retinol acyltransferase family protein [Niabella sp.]HRO46765.1 lecithin retinol acyltransferase family protein [Agriterribacter sp.]